MCEVKRFLVLMSCIFIMAASAGCAGPAANTPQTSGTVESLRPGYEVVYRPQLQPGQTWNTVYDELKRTPDIHVWVYLKDDYLTYSRPSMVKDLGFKNNRLEVLHAFGKGQGKTFPLFYYQLLPFDIAVELARDGRRARYAVILPELVTFRIIERATAERLADALFYLQETVKKVMKQQKEQLALFEPIAAQYRELAIKPPVSEDQRRLIVQANALTQQKQYTKAIGQYKKVIELDRTAYPEAYFNLALLCAQENLPASAIFYMEHYLLLVPDAKDARSARDKIYEWEFMMQGKQQGK